MPEMTQHSPGTFAWAELATSDGPAAKKFYTGLFGWGFDDQDMGPGGPYTMLLQNGKRVGALYRMQDEQAAKGVPPHWGSYITVASADDTANRAKELGGKVLAEPFDVFDVGRMAIVQDPTGAMFSIWQARNHKGAELVGETGSLCWNELSTTSVDQAGAFYTNLMGWTASSHMGPDYTVFMLGEKRVGGMLQMKMEWKGMPPHWMVYFGVDDCDRSAARVQALGGKITVPPTDVPNTGRFAVAQDPQAAVFAIIALTRATS
jgi:hypothetical protein